MSIKHIFSVLFNQKKDENSCNDALLSIFQPALNIFKNVRQCGKRK